MTFNWFSLAAAVVNLLILYWILQRYLFGPLLKTIKTSKSSGYRRKKNYSRKNWRLHPEKNN